MYNTSLMVTITTDTQSEAVLDQSVRAEVERQCTLMAEQLCHVLSYMAHLAQPETHEDKKQTFTKTYCESFEVGRLAYKTILTMNIEANFDINEAGLVCLAQQLMTRHILKTYRKTIEETLTRLNEFYDIIEVMVNLLSTYRRLPFSVLVRKRYEKLKAHLASGNPRDRFSGRASLGRNYTKPRRRKPNK